MPRNGIGTYTPPAGQPVVSGTTVLASTFNALVADVSTELTKSISTDGQTPMAAALPMGNNKITGMAVATLATDAARYDQVTTKVNTSDLAASTGTALVKGTWFGGVIAYVSDLATSIGSSLIAFIQAGVGAVLRSVQDRLRDSVSVFDFMTAAQIADVRSGTGAVDVTAAVQAAINFCVLIKRQLFCPAGVYLVTGSLSMPSGTQLVGELGFAYNNGFGIQPGGTTINFRPTIPNTDLFIANGTTYGSFRLHYSVDGFYINGNANARYALDLDHVIYSRFENLAIDTFQYPIRCNGTINNRFCNVYLSGTTGSVLYVGNNETTDIWEQPTFFGGPSGPIFLGSSIGVRFIDPLFEQLNTYGMQIAKECQAIQVITGYGEDCPYTNTATGAMFQVGYLGTTLNAEVQLVIIGGKYSGRNAGVVGSFLDTDFCNGVIMQGVTHSRFTNIIKTSANTRVNSIAVAGGGGLGWTTYATDITRINGTYPSSVNNSGSSTQMARLPAVTSDSLTSLDGTTAISLVGGALQLIIGAGNAIYPSSDNVVRLGLPANRLNTVYAGTGTINTSDGTEKQQIGPIDAAVLRAWAKVEYCQFKFNDAVALKGSGARIHFGVIAQQVKAAFESEGLDPFAYGVLCLDKWDARDAVLDADGQVVTPAREAGERYGVRHDEALVLECAYLRSKLTP